jgi:hypothetical protein
MILLGTAGVKEQLHHHSTVTDVCIIRDDGHCHWHCEATTWRFLLEHPLHFVVHLHAEQPLLLELMLHAVEDPQLQLLDRGDNAQ